MKFREFLFITENNQFEQKKQFFVQQGNDPNIVQYYINKFSELRKLYPTTKAWNIDLPGFTVPKNKRTDINQYKLFKELEQIVDYVNGQVKPIQLKKVEIDGKPIYKNQFVEIYHAPDKHACIQYGTGYSWCVSRSDASNMYNTYRYKENEPSFYFVKNIEKTNKELENNSNGEWLDKYHMFVIQVMKNGYIVTSANNDGDIRVTWEDIINIEPHLSKLKKLFVHYALSDKEREDYKRFSGSLNDEQFKKLSYEEKEKYLDIYVSLYNRLTDEQFKDLPYDLKNKYVGFGIVLPLSQLDMIKSDKKLLDRHYEMMKRMATSNESYIFDDLVIENKREDLFNLIIKNQPNNPAQIVRYYIDNNKEVPDELMEFILENIERSYYLARNYVDNNEEVPDELMEFILKDAEHSYYLVKNYFDGDKEVPNKLLKSVSHDQNYSYHLAYYYFENNKEIPEILLQPIKKTTWIVLLAKNCLYNKKEVPDKLLQLISKVPEHSFILSQEYIDHKKEIPEELLQAISKNLHYSSNLAEYYIDNDKEVPGILLQSISENPRYSSTLKQYYIDNDKEVPEILKH